VRLFFKLKKAKANIYQSLNEKQAQEIADELGVRPKDVLEMESRLQFNKQKINKNKTELKNAP
jgi:RNA polymerase sigma-32 factor